MPVIERDFELTDTFHLGAYDYLTRVMYPLVAGPENVKHNTVMSERCVKLARAFNPDCFEPFSACGGSFCARNSDGGHPASPLSVLLLADDARPTPTRSSSTSMR